MGGRWACHKATQLCGSLTGSRTEKQEVCHQCGWGLGDRGEKASVSGSLYNMLSGSDQVSMALRLDDTHMPPVCPHLPQSSSFGFFFSVPVMTGWSGTLVWL